MINKLGLRNTNKPFVITAVSVVANPDFQKIKENNFSTYFCETFCTTSEKYYGNTKSFSLWKEGIENKIDLKTFILYAFNFLFVMRLHILD